MTTKSNNTQTLQNVSSDLIREKYIQIYKGNAVLVSEQLLDALLKRSTRANLALEIVSIPNPKQLGTKDSLLAGYISAPEIEAYRLRHGLEDPKQVELIHSISQVSGLTLNEVYSLREGVNVECRLEALESSLNNWRWRAGIVLMPTNIKELDLTKKDDLMRAMQIQFAEERKRVALKYCEKYYSTCLDVKAQEIKKAEAAFVHDLSDPQMVSNEKVADAILSHNAQDLVYYFLNGLFKACEKVFGMATGVKVSNLSKANKQSALLEWGASWVGNAKH